VARQQRPVVTTTWRPSLSQTLRNVG